MSAYFDALCEAMTRLGERPETLFMGQAVAVAGTAMSTTLAGVAQAKRIEMPVAEEMQMGMATGMALDGLTPICLYPRFNFLLLAANQLINHLDKLPLYSDGGYRPRVIVRTAIATPHPLDPGPQHLGDFTEAFRSMLSTVHVQLLSHAASIVPAYEAAARRPGASLLVEVSAYY